MCELDGLRLAFADIFSPSRSVASTFKAFNLAKTELNASSMCH